MPLPPLRNPAAWVALVANPGLKGFSSEELTTKFHFCRRTTPTRVRDILAKELWVRLERRAKAYLGRYAASDRQEICDDAMDHLLEGLMHRNSSDGIFLRACFARTVFVRTVDAERRWLRRHNRTAELDELHHFKDTSIEGDAELQLMLRQIRETITSPGALAGFDEIVYGIPQDASVPASTQRRHRAEAKDIILGDFSEGFMHFATDKPAPTAPLSLPPGMTVEEYCLLAFALDSGPYPSDANIERWCSRVPQFEGVIRRCAEGMRLEWTDVHAGHPVDA